MESPLHQFVVKELIPLHVAGYNISFTNSALFMFLAVVGVALLFFLGMRKSTLVPGRLQSIVELCFEFVDNIVGGVIPRQYIPAVEKGIIECMKEGLVAGYPVIDMRATLYDGSYHTVDSSEMAFKIAGSMAIQAACKKADPKLMEPVMAVEVVVPEEYLGDVMGDISSRRGKVQGMNPRKDAQVVNAFVPLSEMFGYATDLRSLTQGRAVFSMQFDHYGLVPNSISEKVFEKSKG